jgi:D-alanyl-D-alanine dipeptidase
MKKRLFDECRNHPAFRPLSGLKHVALDLRYAGPHNFTGRDLYGGEREAWLRVEAAEALARAARRLEAQRPAWKLRIFDATRPHCVQVELYAQVQGTPRQAYVADPAHGSVHSYGYAVDLSLQDEAGREADLGTAFDSFEELAQPQLEQAIFQQGRLNAEQLGLRRLLRSVMEAEGFRVHPMEWWHFELRSLAELRREGFQRVEGLFTGPD